MSENLNVRATLSASNQMSPALRRVIADIEKLKSVARSLTASFNNAGRAGMETMAGFDRTIRATSAQMKNLSRSAARNYSTDWTSSKRQAPE